MNVEQKNAYLDAKLREIGEHFDCVQILACEQTDRGGTQAYFRGTGNYYARVGLTKEFLERDMFSTAEAVRRNMEAENEE